MSKRIAIVDYGMGNVRSVVNAFEYVGAEVKLSNDPKDLRDAAGIVVPGQGAFRDCIQCLKQKRFTLILEEEVKQKGKPYLGICLGLEILADKSYEGGEFSGLGWIPGVIKKFDLPAKFKVPHLGWNDVITEKPTSLLANLSDPPCFYFAHSYYLEPTNSRVVIASCDYGIKFAAAVQQENIFAVQFHPEKSQKDGLQLIKNFAEIVNHG